MSASVLSRAYTEGGGLSSGPATPRTPGMTTRETTLTLPASNLKQGDRTRLLGVPGSGLRISFAADTSFIERKLRSRGTSRSAAVTSLNLRPMQGSEKVFKSRTRLPKATNSPSVRYTTVSHDEYMNPRKAIDIAKSYGVPKYFLRGNTQILTDGRMRLFGDNVWKKERTTADVDRTTVESSDVMHRLIDSVDKAIATSEKGAGATPPVDDGGLKLEVISLKSGTEDRASLKGSIVSLPDVNNPSRGKNEEHKTNENDDEFDDSALQGVDAVSEVVGRGEKNFDAIRPHTVDTVPTVPKHLPRVTFRDHPEGFDGNEILGISEEEQSGIPVATTYSNVRLRHLASPFRGVSQPMNSGKVNLFGEKYQNVLPRFYPALSAHKNRQAEAERSARHKKKGGQQRLVRFADTHTVRFSNEVTQQEPVGSLVARRAPVQSVQRALDSHSGLTQSERIRARLKEISDHNRARTVTSLDLSSSKTPEKKAYLFQVESSRPAADE